MDKYTIAPPAGSTNNSVGASDRPWHEGHFGSIKINGGDLGTYLAESTGYGIVSGCEPTISGLTVTVGAGIVHLADGTRREIAETNITLDNADPSNPRIDLVYIDSTGAVAKITGTAGASPVVPSVPTGGISVANVSVAAGATAGTVWDVRQWLENTSVEFLFPMNNSYSEGGDCEIIKSTHNVMMIDTGNVDTGTADYILDYLNNNGIFKIDYLLITHYHADHVSNLQQMLNSNKIDWSTTIFFLPIDVTTPDTPSINYDTVAGWIGNRGAIVKCDKNMSFLLDKDVRVDLFNCADTDRAYYQANNYYYNAYSICALITHKAIKAIFTGDASASEKHFYDEGYAEKVDLYKVAHHGSNQPQQNAAISREWLRALAPNVSILNANAGGWYNGDASGEATYLSSIGSKIGWLALGNAKFISNGIDIQDISPNGEIWILQNNYQVFDLYVDPAAASAHPTGTQDNPFPTVSQALARVPLGVQCALHLANGTYDNITIINKEWVELIFSNITVNSLYVRNSLLEMGNGTITVGTLTSVFSKIKAYTTTINHNTTGENKFKLSDSIMNVKNVNLINTSATPANTAIRADNSVLKIITLTSNHFYFVVDFTGGSSVYIRTITADYVYQIMREDSEGRAVVGTATATNIYNSNTDKVYSKVIVDNGQLIYKTSPF